MNRAFGIGKNTGQLCATCLLSLMWVCLTYAGRKPPTMQQRTDEPDSLMLRAVHVQKTLPTDNECLERALMTLTITPLAIPAWCVGCQNSALEQYLAEL